MHCLTLSEALRTEHQPQGLCGKQIQQRSQTTEPSVFISVALCGKIVLILLEKHHFLDSVLTFLAHLMLIEVVTSMNADANERLRRLLSGQWL